MKYNEFSKISIHNHIDGNNCERKLDEQYDKELSFDLELPTNLLKDAKNNDYDLLAMTNANVFRIEDYLKAKYIAKSYDINIIPGVELNVSNEDMTKFLHVVLLVDSKSNLVKFSKKVDEIIEINKNNYIDINQLVDTVGVQNYI